MLICIGGVCVPYTAIVPIVILALKWILEKFGLQEYLPQFLQDMLQVRGIPPSSTDKSLTETTTEISKTAGPSKVQTLESVEELEDLLSKAKVKVVCKFTGTWCVPCKKIQPFFQTISGQPQYQKKKDGSNVLFRTIDVDEFDELANKYKVSMMPTFVVLQGDKVLGTYSGSNEHELNVFLKETVGGSAPAAAKNGDDNKTRAVNLKEEAKPINKSNTTEAPEKTATEAPAAPKAINAEASTTKAPEEPTNDGRDPLVFPCFLAPPTGTTLSMPYAPFRKEDEGKENNITIEAPAAEAPALVNETPEKTAVAEAPAAPKAINAEASTTKAPEAPTNDGRDPLVFPCFLAPPTGTTLSMPYAPFRKEDEGKEYNDTVEPPAATATETPPAKVTTEEAPTPAAPANDATSEEEQLNKQIAELGAQIKKAKDEKKPKEEFDPIVKEMLALKAKFKEVTGKHHGPPKKEKKKTPQNSGQQEASEKNKAKNAAKAAKKAEKAAKKAAQQAERKAREEAKANALAGIGQDNFGDAKMVQSHEITDKRWVPVANLNPSLAGLKVRVRGYLQTSRGLGKRAFVLIRSTLYTVQGVASKSEAVTQDMIKYIAALPVESVVEVEGILTVPDDPVESATQKMVEIQISSFNCISKAKQALPFLMEDACRPDEKKEADVGAYDENEEVQREDGLVRVGDKNRLDNRWLDLRTPANQSIMRIESMVGCLFRECLLSKGFIELHAPKLIAGSSEGGADVFQLDYFGQPACLAMSPQLHKQMAAACSGFERVFTTGPVFRAENSNTRRHLCEFTGFDLEMAIREHYDEVLDVFSDLFIHIFDGINQRCKAELERIREQHPFEDLKYLRPTLKLTYAEGCALLREAGIDQDDYEDLSTENEKKLGDIVKEKYGTDFFFMDKYPLSVRPFYTMPCPENPKLSNSYDFFIRGQEILSGAQRIHEPDFIEERAKAWGIDISTIEEYVNSFRNGALPHGGGGIGLERVVMLFLGLPNIRKASWFPRDPRRLAP